MSRKKKSRKAGSLGPKAQPRVKERKKTQSKKKGKGQPSGQRAQDKATQSQQLPLQQQMSGLGSRKKIPLIAPGATEAASASLDVSEQKEIEMRLMQIEHDPRFNRLLDKVEKEAELSREDQAWFDSMLDEVETLMQKLGIDADAEIDEDSDLPSTESDDDLLSRFESE